MKKTLLIFFSLLALLGFIIVKHIGEVRAYDPVTIDLPVRSCSAVPGQGSCPIDLINIYNKLGQPCVRTFEEFKDDPYLYHYWIDDPKITAQGKADERARQFIYWAINRNSIDDHPALMSIWNEARWISYFMLILVAAIMGVGMIVGQRANFAQKVPIWPSIFKLLTLLLYITFSAALVITIVNLSDLLMKFFIESLGGKDLFNIYYAAVDREESYINWTGCRDLNFRVQEGVDAEMFLLKLTNVTYYVMGSMIILRKILLWFLMFVSPFLALLMPFIFIRNIGWIWIGVFFQWVFYGPLFALFLGATATIWKHGIPFNFVFKGRAGTPAGYVYPTGINILYGGPAQSLHGLNNGNYIDTFVEYIITLLMLWAVTFFPWWLLRIFRDYCCEGIIAMKNILLSMYDQMRGGPPIPPGPTPTPATIATSLKIPREIEIPLKIKLETTEEIKRATTAQIAQSLNISAQHLTDIARFETNKQVQQNINKNINYLRNPVQAENFSDRQKYMSLRTELFNRAVKDDVAAKQIISAVTASKMEQLQHRDEILRTVPKMVPVMKVVSIRVKMPQDKVQSVTSSLVKSASANVDLVNSIAAATTLQTTQVQSVLNALTQNINAPVNTITQSIATQTGLEKQKVVTILQTFGKTVSQNKELTAQIASLENVKAEEVSNVVNAQLPVIAEPEKHVEQTVAIPPTVSLEDYEQVKSMWKSQYEKGEVPVSENIKSRVEWVEKDIVTITNTLNKLMSTEEKLRQSGLDEVGYILPIFLINNLKGGELVVYLKAKLEAAKAVQEEKAKEKEIEEKVKEKATEEFVEVAKPKEAEKEKTMEMKEEIKEEEEKPEDIK